jgi:hypothetical protein
VPYDADFYRMYREYLQEKSVRLSHDYAFGWFRKTAGDDAAVVDLGCGLGEYLTYGYHQGYVGVDLNNAGQVPNFVQADYHDLAFVDRLPFKPTVFTSLFSIECFHSVDDKYALYERIFNRIPSVTYGLASGFFYRSKRDQEKVGETGGIESYQTVEDPAQHISKIFSELRLHVSTPSKMFGEDVVEVWKIFHRR